MIFDELNDQIYDETFEAQCRAIDHKKEKYEHFTIEKLESLLKTAYDAMNKSWGAVNGVHEIELNATIAAYEFKLAEWKNEINHGEK